jgi:hypothetical protein
MGFLDDYEDVQDRVTRFKIAFPVGRIVTDIIQFDAEKGHILVAASIYREHEDTLPASVDYAFGNRDTYPLNMRRFYVEDTCSSAIGRALNGVLETIKKPTKQDMAKVEAKMEAKAAPAQFVNTWDEFIDEPKKKEEPVSMEAAAQLIQQELGATPDEPIPHCRHGEMQIKEGNKNGKPWRGAMCSAGIKGGMTSEKCPPVWYVVSKSTGKWRLPDGVE